VTVHLRIDSRLSEAYFARLKRKAPIAIARALNRANASGKTVLTRIIAQDMGIRQKDVRDKILLIPARPAREALVASMRASIKPIPTIAFGARGPDPSRGRGRGVTWRNQGQRKREPRAFITTVRAGATGQHKGVFIRKDRFSKRHGGQHKGQLPITQLMGPSIWYVFTRRAPEALPRIEERLAREVEHQLAFAMSEA